jgi:uncharacterized NAD(P)/FAD-binding protein YdhS
MSTRQKVRAQDAMITIRAYSDEKARVMALARSMRLSVSELFREFIAWLEKQSKK